MREEKQMINHKRKVLVIITALVMALVIGSVAAYAGVGTPVWTVQNPKEKKAKVSVMAADFRYTKKYKKAYKNVKKVIVYKKADKAKKYKKYKTLKIDKTIYDKKATGFVQYKFQPVNKKGKKGKKTMALSVFVLNKVGTVKTKEVEQGTILSVKLKNTSKKYNAKIVKGEGGVVAPDGITEEEELALEKAYMCNAAGTKKIKSVTIKKNKAATVNVMVPGLKFNKSYKAKEIHISMFKLKAAKNEFSISIDKNPKTLNTSMMCLNEKEATALWK